MKKSYTGELDTDSLVSLLEVCQAFIKSQRIGSAEVIYQQDNVIENAYDFIEEVCDIVGYYEDGDEEED